MKPPQEIYDSIKPIPQPFTDFVHIPGVYCAGCGETFALYSYSAIPPDGIDENNKPFMNGCPSCKNLLLRGLAPHNFLTN